MHTLSIVKQGGGAYIDSRDVAEVIGKAHRHLLRDIRGYIGIMLKAGLPNFGPSDFFTESSYINEQNKEMPCFLLSKMGCELVANKLTGEKGVLFTAAYVTVYNRMEATERAAAVQSPRLGEFNAASRLIVRAMKNAGVAPDQIVDFLRSVYEPLGITVSVTLGENAHRMYTAYHIAKMLGMYSASGKPHSLAVASILNDLVLDASHKTVVPACYGDHVGISTRYDDFAVSEVRKWLEELEWPDTIFGRYCNYHVTYKNSPTGA